jgi:quercetin dioxygenase-like cupin family protein
MDARYFADAQARAVFRAAGPEPQILYDTPQFKVVVVGLEAGQTLPLHPAAAGAYHFLTGTGEMTVGTEVFAVRPGATVIAGTDVPRGIHAATRLIFLGVRGG